MDLDLMHDEPLQESFQFALIELVRAVEQELGPGAAERVAKWAGVKASTLYGWMEGGSTPSRWQYVVRLAIRSSDEGFPQIVAFCSSPKMRFGWFAEVLANGSLSDEMLEFLRIGGELERAEASGGGEATLRIAEALHALADRVHAEGSHRIGRRAKVTSNGH